MEKPSFQMAFLFYKQLQDWNRGYLYFCYQSNFFMALPKKILTRKDEITSDFLKLMDKHINDLLKGRVDHKFHASDFAELLFIHPRHLSNTIKLTTGKSPCDFIEERIMIEAERFLRETKLSVAEIGQVFCYDEPTNFTKFFKGMCGITPLQFRKKVVA